MSQNELLAIALFAGPAVLVIFLRANAALVFLSMCTGYAVGQLLGSDINAFADMLLPGVGEQTLRLGLVAVPGILTALFYTRSVRSIQRFLNIIPSLGVGCLSVVLAVPVLVPSVSHAIMQLALWQQFARVQALVLGGSAVVSLLFLWLQRPAGRKESSDKKSSRD